jgi:hypothetical protein
MPTFSTSTKSANLKGQVSFGRMLWLEDGTIQVETTISTYTNKEWIGHLIVEGSTMNELQANGKSKVVQQFAALGVTVAANLSDVWVRGL